MDRKWLPLNALRAFEAAGRHLSFTAAANSLTVAQSAVSRHVIMLENFVGTPLFERKPQNLTLTKAGKHLLPVVQKSFDRIDQALNEIVQEGGSPRQALKVSLPATFAHQLAVPILRDFRVEHPGITLDIETGIAASHEGEAALRVVYCEPRVTDAILDLLWSVRLTILCHPDVAARGPLADLRAFIANNDLLHVRLDDKPRNLRWTLLARQLSHESPDHGDLDMDRGLVFDTAGLAAQYALAGEGIALLDPMLFQAELAAGTLVRPFDVWLNDGLGYYLSIFPEDLNAEPVALFRSWLIKRFSRRHGPKP